MEQAPRELVERFSCLSPGGPEAEARKMFGFPACFLRGNIFMGCTSGT